MTNTAISTSSPQKLREAQQKFTLERRDYFLDNLFISEWIEYVDEDDDYDIVVVDVFDRRFIALLPRHSGLDMAYVQRDGSVYVCEANGMCGGIQSPMLYGMDDIDRRGEWYAGDEIEQIGTIDIDNESHKWYNMVNAIKPQVYSVSKATLRLINDRFFLDTSEDD